ncbi:MAG: VWA domain-containing protein [Candidatus Acidiferrales bacterium]
MDFPSKKKALRAGPAARWFSRVLPVSALGFALLALAQQPASEPKLPSPALRVETRLVLVDVVVTDKKGNPVPGLTRQDFALKEEGEPQEISVFEWNSAAAPPSAPSPLPPHVYTNRPEYHPPRGALTIVLLDALNTARKDQVLMREEALHYLGSPAASGQWTAIMVLTKRLRVLQDFTTDRELLLAAVKNFEPEQSALLSTREMVTSCEMRAYYEYLRELSADFGDPPSRIDELQQKEQSFMAQSDKERAELTLAALRDIGQSVLGYPGRKNLVWLSGSFLALYPGREKWSMDTEMRKTGQLLSDARVAVYPVDPRGLDTLASDETIGEFEQRVGRRSMRVDPNYGYVNMPTGSVSDPKVYFQSTLGAMNALAESTGGQAFYNRNDLSTAVAMAVSDGSAYYTLGYYPKNESWDGGYRRLAVKLAPPPAGLELRYRAGYYAAALPKSADTAPRTEEEISADLLPALTGPVPATGLTFQARVPPPALADPLLVAIEVWLDTTSQVFRELPEGAREADFDFVAAAFSPEGALLKNVARHVHWRLTPAEYQQAVRRGVVLPVRMELTPGTYQLRLLLRDNRTGLLGRVDVPLPAASASSP